MILTTTDGSRRAASVLPHAARLAAVLEQPLQLLRILEANETPASAITEALSADLAAASIKGDVATEELRSGESVADAILRFAAEHRANLLAMDSRGQNVLRHALLGSVTMSVLGKSPLPVLVTGPEVQAPLERDPYTILVTSDGSPASSAVFGGLAEILQHDAVRVFLVSAYVPAIGDGTEEEEVARLRERLEVQANEQLPNCNCEIVVSAARDLETPDRQVLQIAEEVGASAIAMATRGHSGLRHVVVGSFASAVLSRSRLPVFLVRG